MSNLPVLTRTADDRIKVLEKEVQRWQGIANWVAAEHNELSDRIKRAIPLVGHTSLNSRRELLAILQGEEA